MAGEQPYRASRSAIIRFCLRGSAKNSVVPLRFISQTLKINRRGNYKGFAECAEHSTAATEITKPAKKRKSL